MYKFTCIVPFYNEGRQVLTVISKILEVKEIDQVICVNDGSSDNISNQISTKHPVVKLINLKTNQGKANAVFEGLKYAVNENILLMDADWLNLKYFEIQKALLRYEQNNLDMLILKNIGTNSWIDEKLRKYIFLSGNRILKKSNLKDIEKLKPEGYQLEVAINKYMMDKQKRVAWIQTSAYNPHKVVKLGFLKGMLEDLQMQWEIFSYIGLFSYYKQMFTFCREEMK